MESTDGEGGGGGVSGIYSEYLCILYVFMFSSRARVCVWGGGGVVKIYIVYIYMNDFVVVTSVVEICIKFNLFAVAYMF